ncbi:MAG TPA: hypothetical protein PKO06_14785, partial [Candidatus Ozemobacteraceae bacterium]|nr:hypothetical protein [Candidatus Ozemobacteraceae bacterium]
VVLKKMLYATGLINAAYLGMNDLVAALQMAKKSDDPKMISAQLLAVRLGLDAKPALLRHIAQEIRQCEAYPKFPLGFNDGPEGPELISDEFEKMAFAIENLNIQPHLTTLAALRKEAERVVFAIFWTESEKMRALAHDIHTFLRVELKEDLPFDVFTKPRSSR